MQQNKTSVIGNGSQEPCNFFYTNFYENYFIFKRQAFIRRLVTKTKIPNGLEKGQQTKTSVIANGSREHCKVLYKTFTRIILRLNGKYLLVA